MRTHETPTSLRLASPARCPGSICAHLLPRGGALEDALAGRVASFVGLHSPSGGRPHPGQVQCQASWTYCCPSPVQSASHRLLGEPRTASPGTALPPRARQATAMAGTTTTWLDTRPSGAVSSLGNQESPRTASVQPRRTRSHGRRGLGGAGRGPTAPQQGRPAEGLSGWNRGGGPGTSRRREGQLSPVHLRVGRPAWRGTGGLEEAEKGGGMEGGVQAPPHSSDRELPRPRLR